jgi:CubicO group peptidase (beta-lactamase class C family)
MKIRFSFLAAMILAFTTFGSGRLAARPSQKATGQPAAASDAERLSHLEQRLDGLRQQFKIPAMSCAIVKDQKVVWAKGFGYADGENKIPATGRRTAQSQIPNQKLETTNQKPETRRT